MFVTTLLTGFIISSITVGFILLIKKLFQKQLSAKWQYNLWYLLLAALVIPFIPAHLLPSGNLFTSFTGSPSPNGGSASINSEASGTEGTNASWMQDFSVTVTQTNTELLNGTVLGIWVAGALILTIFAIRAWLNLRRIKKSVSQVENKEVIDLFIQSKQQLNISKNITLGISNRVRSPLAFGLAKTFVVLPANFEEWLSHEDIKHIFLHELNHYKYKDISTNYLMVFFQIIYWFNPLIWIAFKAMRLDREIACDHAVLTSLDEQSYKKYGNTIIHFIDKSSTHQYNKLANQLNGSKKQIKKRIIEIASFQADSKLQHARSIGIFLLAGLFIVAQMPLASVMANDNDRYTSFNHNQQTKEEDLSAYFQNYNGSFVLYDMQEDTYHIYDKDQSTQRVSPDSTYKIYSALFGLEENIITTEQNTIEWDGTEQPYDQWNQDQNLETALNRSVNWYFQQLDQEMGLDSIQAYLNHINYGNQDISNGNDQYWLESTLKISPVEQVELLQAFYNNHFNFQEEHIQAVKDALQMEEKDGNALYGKTGTGNVNGKDINGWFVGFVETDTNTYFFATNIQDEDNASGSIATEITLAILKDKQIYEG
ncbi:BlaR1 family beta-lactam sensor/signal transducer [Oceanobacillus jeddahense]|uniref:BlaR1 family beta-lactam sensor/signal transducer n=1 Tax=Oceanobacillus jeddahense TaxID=1462527 RepID=UPI003629209F